MLAKTLEFLADESGATAIEYGLIAALVSIASLGALSSLGGSINTVFETVSSNVGTAASDIPSASLDFSAVPTDGAVLEGVSR